MPILINILNTVEIVRKFQGFWNTLEFELLLSSENHTFSIEDFVHFLLLTATKIIKVKR